MQLRFELYDKKRVLDIGARPQQETLFVGNANMRSLPDDLESGNEKGGRWGRPCF
jgi:hypothetical protein